MNVEIHHSVDEIQKSIDQISDDGFFTYGWFKTLESFGRVPEPFYLTIGNEAETLAIAPCFLDRQDDFFGWGPNIFPFFHRVLSVGDKLGLFDKDLFLCYSPACCRTKVLFNDRFPPGKMIELFSNKIDVLCKSQKTLFSCFLFVSEFDRRLMEKLHDADYAKFDNVLTFYLKIKWGEFDDYLKSLKPGMAKKIRREIKKCSENGVVISQERITQEIANELSQLNANVSLKHSDGLAVYKLDPSFFLTLQEYAKEKVKLFVARRNHEVIGFSLALQHKDTLDVYMYGSNYESQTNTFFTYFNLVYYRPIQLAIDMKLTKIYFRYYLAKSRVDRGCSPERTYTFVKCQYPIFGTVINRLLRTPFYTKVRSRFLKDFFPNS